MSLARQTHELLLEIGIRSSRTKLSRLEKTRRGRDALVEMQVFVDAVLNGPADWAASIAEACATMFEKLMSRRIRRIFSDRWRNWSHDPQESVLLPPFGLLRIRVPDARSQRHVEYSIDEVERWSAALRARIARGLVCRRCQGSGRNLAAKLGTNLNCPECDGSGMLTVYRHGKSALFTEWQDGSGSSINTTLRSERCGLDMTGRILVSATCPGCTLCRKPVGWTPDRP